MLPQDYIVQSKSNSCLFGFIPNQGSEFWILGDSFFRGYYTIHDDVNGRMGIVPHDYSIKRELYWTEVPLNALPSHLKTEFEHLFCIVAVATFCFIFFINLSSLMRWSIPIPDFN
jgi:hypothetical protein